MKPFQLLLLSLALAGCSAEMSLTPNPAQGQDALNESLLQRLRLDVRPADAYDAEGELRLLPQTFGPVLVDAPMTISLQAVSTVTGEITGELVTPWRGADLPSLDVAVSGKISLRRAFTLQTYNASTTGSGSFQFGAVPGEGYQLSITPDDAEIPPFSGTLDVNVRNAPLDLHIEPGTPIWGTVFTDVSLPMAGARVHALLADGTPGGEAITNAQGQYLLRVPEGTVQVLCEGRDNGRDPVLVGSAFEVGPSGAQRDMQYGPLVLRGVSGRLVREDGRALSGITIRFTATKLLGYDDAELDAARASIEVTTNNSGLFDARLIPGEYSMAVLPGTRDLQATFSLIRLNVTEGVNLGDVRLDDLTIARVEIATTLGSAVPDAILTCTEAAPGARSWTGFADEFGAVSLALPEGPLTCLAAPPGARTDLAMLPFAWDTTESASLAIDLPGGREVSGTVIGPDGPEPYAVVELRDTSDQLWAAGLTDERGEFRVRLALPYPD